MKKLIYFASALMIFGLTSCNNELGPEYTTSPKFDNATMSYDLLKNTEEPKTVPVDATVTFTCTVTNTYGWSIAYFYYRTLEPAEYDGLGEDEIEKLWIEKFSQRDEKYTEMSYEMQSQTPVTDKHFTYTIPGQSTVGTKVRWDYGIVNQYGLGFGYIASGYVPRNEYTVVENPTAGPTTPNNPTGGEDEE